MQRILTTLLLVACSVASFASTKVSLIFPDASEKLIFESATWPINEPTTETKSMLTKVDYNIVSSTATDKLFIVDTTSGKVANKAIGEIKNGTWTLTTADFTAVYKVKVEVTTPKGPVAAATVDIESGSDKRNQLIDPASNGVATFLFVKAGELKVSVNHKAGGKAKDPVRQFFTVSGENSTLKVALPDGEAVAAPATGATGASNEPMKTTSTKDGKSDEKAQDPGSPLGSLLSTLIGLAIVIGVGYFIVKYIQKNPDLVKGALTKLGADIPQPADPNAVAHDHNPVAPIAPQPMQQIILDGGAPSPVAAASVPFQQIQQSAPPAVSGVPKLVATDGSAFDLPEGETIVGREFGAGLVVPNDTISRKHASVLKNGGSVELQDHGSTNGTWINGGKLSGSQILRPGDSVRFGSVEYRFEG